MKINEPMKMTGKCAIQCAAAEDGKPQGNPKFTIDAYNGGIMNVNGFGPIVVDLQGMKVSDVVLVAYGHDTHSLDAIMGQTAKIEKTNKLVATGEIMNDSEMAERVVGLSKRGFSFQASIGATPYILEDVQAGASVEVNGQTISGPFTLVKESQLDEISIVPLGADKTTATAIAAAKQRGENMSTENMDKGAEAIRAAAVAEETRIAKVKAAAKDFDEIRASAINDGWTVERTETAVKDAELKAARAELAAIKAAKENEQRPTPPAIKIEGEKQVEARVIEAAACMRAGLKSPEQSYDSETLNKAADLKVRSITDLVQAALRAEGKRLECSRHDTRDFLQAAFSTRSISNILSNLANKFIREGYGMVEQAWREVANVRSVVDFKANTGNRLVMANLLKELAPSGEIEHGKLSDEVRTIQADTKALMLGVSRKDIINDDLSALTELPRKLGFAAGRTFNTDFWAALVAALGTAFPTNNSKGNYLNISLDLAGLALAEQAFMSLKDSDGNPIGTEASILLTGPAKSVAARELFVSTNLVATGTGNAAKRDAAANVFANKYQPVASRYLSGNGWYLVANPMGIPLMEVAFLNGQQEPTVETADADFNTLGVQMRCYYDYGCAFAEDKAAVYSAGG
jgi:hypothetical protein